MTGLREFGKSAATAVLERVGRGVSKVQERKPLPYDVLESDGAYLVVFDAPGVTRSDVQVRYIDGEVQVRLDRFRDFHEGFEMRFPGRGLSLDGRARLPPDADVDAGDASATLKENGTLQVRVPKQASGTDVTVQTEDGDEDEDDGDESA
ncbi:Hsp20/alpha crystallin family protein [Haloplanus halobius]|uniref:Hsp20/alpha crystallin family protein n=1 Tax=Haloplanus halobius TaxID=2934938 RepID=UPI00200F575B|nr:Hsp20/alpha crystallin family protein [Haloplanus sp. XH21]